MFAGMPFSEGKMALERLIHRRRKVGRCRKSVESISDHGWRLNIPDETLLALKLSADAAEHEVVLVAAVKLYEMGRLSGGGAAAQLTGLPKPVFMANSAYRTFRRTRPIVAPGRSPYAMSSPSGKVELRRNVAG
jgi:hypothetical protein